MKSSRQQDGEKLKRVLSMCMYTSHSGCVTIIYVPLHPYPAFRSSCQQQSVHEDPAAAKHTEEAQETPAQRVLH